MSSSSTSLTTIPVSVPEPLSPTRSPQPLATVQLPVEPSPPKRALRRRVKPERPPAQVNSLSPLNTPPHGVKCAVAFSPLTTVPDSQPSSDASNSLTSLVKSVWATISTGLPEGTATAGAAVPAEKRKAAPAATAAVLRIEPPGFRVVPRGNSSVLAPRRAPQPINAPPATGGSVSPPGGG